MRIPPHFMPWPTIWSALDTAGQLSRYCGVWNFKLPPLDAA